MSAGKNPGREAILNRIRRALQQSSPAPEPPLRTPVFPPITDLLDRFRSECAANLVECIVTSSSATSANAISSTLASLPGGDIFVQDAPKLRALLDDVFAHQDAEPGLAARIRSIWSSEGRLPEAAQASITLAELLVAGTGSIVVSSSCGGRSASVAVPCHIVYATSAQLVADLDETFAVLSSRGTMLQNSFVGLITGSSRTADIEKILVLGAHGPRRVVVVLETCG